MFYQYLLHAFFYVVNTILHYFLLCYVIFFCFVAFMPHSHHRQRWDYYYDYKVFMYVRYTVSHLDCRRPEKDRFNAFCALLLKGSNLILAYFVWEMLKFGLFGRLFHLLRLNLSLRWDGFFSGFKFCISGSARGWLDPLFEKNWPKQ